MHNIFSNSSIDILNITANSSNLFFFGFFNNSSLNHLVGNPQIAFAPSAFKPFFSDAHQSCVPWFRARVICQVYQLVQRIVPVRDLVFSACLFCPVSKGIIAILRLVSQYICNSYLVYFHSLSTFLVFLLQPIVPKLQRMYW